MAAISQRVPVVIDCRVRGEREMDIFSRLLKDRIVFITGSIGDELANLVVAQLLFLSNEDPKSELHLYINSPGGSVSAGLAVYDTMQYLRCDVATYNVGLCASMGAIVLCGGVMEGSATDLSIEAEEIIRLRKVLYNIVSSRTGKNVETVEKDCDRNKWFSSTETIEYGLADSVLERMPAAAP